MKNNNNTKYIIITGGVLSGLGKGITTASIGRLLSSRLKIVPIKCDGYLNTDPGTMNPIEHGEVFVLDDGGEVDMDFGHYERFLSIQCKSKWNITMGKIFKRILEKERRGDFLGKTVQFIPHVTNEIKNRIYSIADKENAELVIIEIGGTVGDIENQLFLEAVRQLGNEFREDSVFIHLTYIPVLKGSNEQKSKPTQQSVKLLNELGIEPDIIIGRCAGYINDSIKDKIALFCSVNREEVISAIDVDSIYEIPVIFEKDKLSEILHKKLNIYSPPKLNQWTKLVNNIKRKKIKKVTIAVCGKYTKLEDSYASIKETLVHCEAHLKVKIKTKWIGTSQYESNPKLIPKDMEEVDAVIVPGGFGIRGYEGKIKVIRYVRENNIPFLGICLGMQLAVVEYARNVCGLKGANTTESDKRIRKAKHPVIDILPEQKNVTSKGATMRLGGQDVFIKRNTVANKIYKKNKIRMRFRHRYEVNPEYIDILTENGLVFSGYDQSKRIMQVLELKDHNYFMACQFHPELTSRIEQPDPLFYNLIKNAMK